MEIPRHWRLKDIRIQFKGWRYADGRIEIQPRPAYNSEASISSSKLPLYTSGSCKVGQEKEQPVPVQ